MLANYKAGGHLVERVKQSVDRLMERLLCLEDFAADACLILFVSWQFSQEYEL